MNNDPLANVLSNINNAEKIGRKEVVVKPISKIAKTILDLMKTHKYIEGYEEVQDGRGGQIIVKLSGKINKCAVIKPRLPVDKEGYEKFEKRHLPAKDFGFIVVTTPNGIMTQNEAKKKGIGGRVIAYVY
ncbi:MAG: 30S ribosomal protein S8 [Candidatus Nanoarchaeia archaeon]|nr:30S ribosomal protein S8 [Candidatus Nanoarchaeia archaeon]